MKINKSKIKNSGKIIVIDGVDGSGKSTQSELLLKKLKQNKIKAVHIKFPIYKDNFIGKSILEFLTKEEFNFLKVHPKIASLVYASDRFEFREKLKKLVEQGYLVVLERYVSSNQIHQAGKIKDMNERENFSKWLEELEYKIFAIPKPDKIFYLDISLQNSLKLIAQRKGNDLADEDRKYQEESFSGATWFANRKNKNLVKIACEDAQGNLKSREEINDLIYSKLK